MKDKDLIKKAHKKMFVKGTEVIYIPTHVDGSWHKDCERGIVSSFNDKFVFVKFYKQLANFGWKGTTSQSCRPEDLSIEYRI